MRKNQVSIRIQRFGDQVPEGFRPSPNSLHPRAYAACKDGQTQIISVYADANNLYEALAAACHEVLCEVQKYEDLPTFGRREHYD